MQHLCSGMDNTSSYSCQQATHIPDESEDEEYHSEGDLEDLVDDTSDSHDSEKSKGDKITLPSVRVVVREGVREGEVVVRDWW